AILADGAVAVSALQGATRSVPIVFVAIPDPVGAGFVKSLARPGGNTTGFTAFEYAIGAKWLELLKEIAPGVTRAAVLRDPTIAAGIGQFAAIQAVGSIAMELSVIDVRDANAIEQDVAEFAGSPNGGLIVTVGPFGANHPNVITTLADRYKLPAVYPFRYFVGVGGLTSYGPDLVSQFRPAAGYVDRILKGTRPYDLPVQAPTKYELVLNLKTAKALGLEVPATVLARADEVRRRAFMSLLGGAVAWPLAARAQQTAKRPIVGFLGDSTPLAESERAAAFARRLHDLGWIEGRTIAIEYRWADGRSER